MVLIKQTQKTRGKYMKIIDVICNECNKLFKSYGKYDSTIKDCYSHNDKIKSKQNKQRS